MTTKTTLAELARRITEQSSKFTLNTIVVHTKDRFSEYEKDILQDECDLLIDKAEAFRDEIDRRRGHILSTRDGEPLDQNTAPEPVSVVAQPPIADIFARTPYSLIPAGFRAMDIGHKFKGSSADLVVVPVTSRPSLHRSQSGRWSWRTSVAGYDDFRHINVSNFSSSYVNANGDWIVLVDGKWKTDQPVFKYACNK